MTKKELFAKGKRGIIYRFSRGDRTYCLKQPHPKSTAFGNLEHEYFILHLLTHHKLPVPKPYHLLEQGFSYAYIPGITLKQALEEEKLSASLFLKMIITVSKTMYQLDLLGITKEEMQHPWKHILLYDPTVTQEKSSVYPYGIYLIDFERAKKTTKPKNLTQWLQFLTSTTMQKVLLHFNVFYDPKTLRTFAFSYKKALLAYHQAKMTATKKQRKQHSQLEKIWKQIRAYLQQKTFFQQVWHACCKVPPGTVMSYAELAQEIGKPKAARAVALALKANPFAPLVPCHRIVKSNGEIGGYNQGVKKKESFLIQEGIIIKKGKIPKRFFLSRNHQKKQRKRENP